MTQETTEQRDARWLREQEADAVAVRLGFAFTDERHGVCYWNGNGDAFRAGYAAGKASASKGLHHEQRRIRTHHYISGRD